ncbi:hypothetical protein INR75_06390 [Zunongwangia sp. SCSIO 43204]|uniref:hypothetical protein n=1 Tax=Zunongwangia sp. SCSIO 43204 TaxID=2779359 RepID=UPI001CA9E5BC|nr:hypothetical protein [Zunongwangia sp. SCSIO 43204]UAB85639.1 hypothetical protein INR75_06390 [Zunongwangia sp. SCSIO 43204]
MKKFIRPFFMLAAGAMIVSCSDDDNMDRNPVMPSGTAHLYATSHDGSVTRYDINNGETTSYETSSDDAEGIYYDGGDDSFTIVSRSSTSLESYAGIGGLQTGIDLDIDLDLSSSSDLESPRDVAVNGNIYVVADNADVDGDDTTPDGRFFVYTKTSSGFELRNIVTVDFKVWGIEFVGNDLYAVVDTTNMLAVFTNFSSNYMTDMEASASKTVEVEGIVRTHGLDYDGGTMVMTDIGDAGSDADGAFHVITNFDSKFNATMDGGMISVSDQMRVEGGNTNLGNPVNVVYDANYDAVFIAELANGGGRVLAFSEASTSSGNRSPQINNSLSGASAVYFYTE